jgi:hypothetical protein
MPNVVQNDIELNIEIPSTPRPPEKSRLTKTSSFPNLASIIPGEEQISHSREERKEKDLKTIGRCRDDTTGEELPVSEMFWHVLTVLLYFSGGFIFIHIDKLHSYLTGRPRGLGYKKTLSAGTGHLASWFISSLLDPTNDPDGESDNCKGFLRRYYHHCDIYHTSGEELIAAAEKLQLQLYIDISDRAARKAKGDRILLWSSTSFSISVAAISFIRTAIDRANTQHVDLTEASIALIMLTATLSINRKTQADADAKKALEKVRKWAKLYVQARVKAEPSLLEPATQVKNALSFVNKTKHSIFQEKAHYPIEKALLHLHYQIYGIRFLEYSLLDAVVRLQYISGKKTTLKQLQQQIKDFYLEADEEDSLSDLEVISQLYDCPIVIIHEQKQANGTYCLILNETSPEDAESKSPESREENALLLYCSEPEMYQAVLAPHTKAFKNIKQDLTTLKPELRTLKPDLRTVFEGPRSLTSL